MVEDDPNCKERAEQIVTDEVLSTVIAEAVNIINSRPLSRNSDSDSDEQPITPNQLLHLRPMPSLQPGGSIKKIFIVDGFGDRLST